MNIQKLPPEHYLSLIKENKPFSFSRFGDGEALCIFNSEMKENCDGSAFLPELKTPMENIFRNKYPYYHCLLECSFEEHPMLSGEKFRELIETNCSEMTFYDGEIWQELSFSGRIEELTEALSPHNPCFVGGIHLEKISDIKGYEKTNLIVTPEVNSFLFYSDIYKSIINEYINGCRMFCFSCGYTSKILIDNLWPIIGNDTFLIDFGSVWDPYCGKLSRSGMRTKGFNYFKTFLK